MKALLVGILIALVVAGCGSRSESAPETTQLVGHAEPVVDQEVVVPPSLEAQVQAWISIGASRALAVCYARLFDELGHGDLTTPSQLAQVQTEFDPGTATRFGECGRAVEVSSEPTTVATSAT